MHMLGSVYVRRQMISAFWVSVPPFQMFVMGGRAAKCKLHPVHAYRYWTTTFTLYI